MLPTSADLRPAPPLGRGSRDQRDELVVVLLRNAAEERLVEPDAVAAGAGDVALGVGLELGQLRSTARTIVRRQRVQDGFGLDPHGARDESRPRRA
jgi:hypothetical protein